MSDLSPSSESSPTRERLLHVAVDQLHPAPQAPANTTPTSDLVDSIRTYGLLHPLLVRPGENGYEVVAGYKRLAAAREAGLTEVPVRVYRVEDAALEGLRQASNVSSTSASTRAPYAPRSSPHNGPGLSGLLEEEFNRTSHEVPYGPILGSAAILLLCGWIGLRLWNRNPAPSPDEPSPAAIATPSGDSIFFPNDSASETPAAAPSSSVARWRSALGGIDGIEVRDINQVPRVVFTEPVFSRLTSIDADQKPRLKRVAEAIHAAEPSAMLVVIGHTDNDPVRPNSTYQSNEHLGRLRAQAVTKFLSENAPLPEHQLRDSSQGDQNPPFSNASAADKVRNRTVTLEIISPQ